MNDDQFGRLFPATQAAAAIRLRHILRNWVDIDLGRMAPTDEFCKHIGLGRLDGMDVDDFIKDVEKDFGITIPLTKAKTMKTFQEMVDCVVAIGNKSNPGEPAGPAYGPPTAARS